MWVGSLGAEREGGNSGKPGNLKKKKKKVKWFHCYLKKSLSKYINFLKRNIIIQINIILGYKKNQTRGGGCHTLLPPCGRMKQLNKLAQQSKQLITQRGKRGMKQKCFHFHVVKEICFLFLKTKPFAI